MYKLPVNLSLSPTSETESLQNPETSPKIVKPKILSAARKIVLNLFHGRRKMLSLFFYHQHVNCLEIVS